MSVDVVEETGLDFFSELPDEIEKVLEENITNLFEFNLPPVADFLLFPDDDEEDNNASDLSLQAPLLANFQETANLPIVVGGVDNI